MRFLAMVLVLMAAVSGAAAQDLPISAFYGHFVGRGTASGLTSGFFDTSPRDLDVTISAAGSGVQVAWTTYVRKGDDPKSQVVIKRSTSITFQATSRPNVFIEKRGSDPFDGNPLSWARVEGRTLTTYTFVVDEDGLFGLSTYARTLDRQGRVMDLLFESLRGGEKVRSASAKLVRK
jgi:hypothetical protein